jgi:hypothetical protein
MLLLQSPHISQRPRFSEGEEVLEDGEAQFVGHWSLLSFLARHFFRMSSPTLIPVRTPTITDMVMPMFLTRSMLAHANVSNHDPLPITPLPMVALMLAPRRVVRYGCSLVNPAFSGLA